MANIIPVTMRQLHAMVRPAVYYKQALLVRDTNFEQLCEVCRPYVGIVAVAPFSPVPTHEEQVILVRLLRPAQREHAMLLPYWPEIPRVLLTRVTQLRLVAK